MLHDEVYILSMLKVNPLTVIYLIIKKDIYYYGNKWLFDFCEICDCSHLLTTQSLAVSVECLSAPSCQQHFYWCYQQKKKALTIRKSKEQNLYQTWQCGVLTPGHWPCVTPNGILVSNPLNCWIYCFSALQWPDVARRSILWVTTALLLAT